MSSILNRSKFMQAVTKLVRILRIEELEGKNWKVIHKEIISDFSIEVSSLINTAFSKFRGDPSYRISLVTSTLGEDANSLSSERLKSLVQQSKSLEEAIDIISEKGFKFVPQGKDLVCHNTGLLLELFVDEYSGDERWYIPILNDFGPIQHIPGSKKFDSIVHANLVIKSAELEHQLLMAKSKGDFSHSFISSWFNHRSDISSVNQVEFEGYHNYDFKHWELRQIEPGQYPNHEDYARIVEKEIELPTEESIGEDQADPAMFNEVVHSSYYCLYMEHNSKAWYGIPRAHVYPWSSDTEDAQDFFHSDFWEKLDIVIFNDELNNSLNEANYFQKFKNLENKLRYNSQGAIYEAIKLLFTGLDDFWKSEEFKSRKEVIEEYSKIGRLWEMFKSS